MENPIEVQKYDRVQAAENALFNKVSLNFLLLLQFKFNKKILYLIVEN